MATYREFENFVKSEFPVKDNPKNAPKGYMCLEVPCPDDRSHLVFIKPGTKLEKFGEFADVWAMIGELDESDLDEALDLAMALPLGGLAKIGDRIVLRHTIPLEDVDQSEIAKALIFTAFSADVLEEQLVGGDSY